MQERITMTTTTRPLFSQPDLENNTQVTNYNASVGLGYTLFDGFGRKYNYKKLQELSNLSEIQARQVMETALLELLSGYYEVARLTENRYNQYRSLEISKTAKRGKNTV